MSELTEQFLALSVSSPLIPSLPDNVTIDIVARVPVSHYPTLSLVSKSCRKLIASPTLYKRRSFLGCKEQRVYAVLRK
uniref:F-box domain-containing protein n=1 Tax=Brassica oleracea var. oleracea TaxID=109376 RepID=A0A0D3E0Q2_BRAOL